MHRISLFILLIFTNIQVLQADYERGISFPKAEVINEYTTRIPFKIIDQLLVIEAETHDKKGNFIIDSGSETLILNKLHFKTNLSKYKTTYGVNGSIENAQEMKLREFILENFSLKNKKTDIIDLSHIEEAKRIKLLGIIGFNILKDYEIFIDLYLQQITLSKIDKKGNTLNKEVYLEEILDSIPFKLKKHAIVIEGQINGLDVKLGIDSGAEFNQINKDIDPKILEVFQPKRRLKLTGASKNQIYVLAGNLHRVQLSETIYFGPMLTIVTNLKNINFTFKSRLDGILGYEFFKQKRTIINYKKEMLYFIATPKQEN